MYGVGLLPVVAPSRKSRSREQSAAEMCLFPASAPLDMLELRESGRPGASSKWLVDHASPPRRSRIEIGASGSARLAVADAGRGDRLRRRHSDRAVGAESSQGNAESSEGQGRAPAAPTPEAELAAVRDKLDQAKIGPLNTVHSAHYVAIGDAPRAFITIILADCEQLDADYQRYFDSLGFHVHQPDRPLIVIMFRDDRSFGKFFRLPSLLGAAAKGRPLQPAGIYDKTTNVLHVFDWRNVPIEPRASHRNMETLAHEGTHQLSFNTGLLNRAGDTPLCIVEGLGTHGESRKTIRAQ